MPKVDRRRSHSHHVNYRRSIESIASNKTDTYSSEEEEILINSDTGVDHIHFPEEFVLNDVSDLFSFCKEQINTHFISMLMYMPLRLGMHRAFRAQLFPLSKILNTVIHIVAALVIDNTEYKSIISLWRSETLSH